MLEAEYEELNRYTLKASKTVADYYDRYSELNDKDREYVIEKILAELDIILLWTMNIRHQLLIQLNTAPGTVKIAINQALSELKTTQDSAKTLSFNFTAVYHGARDRIKEGIDE